MSQKSDEIREIARRLDYYSVSCDADGYSFITKSDLEQFKKQIVFSLLAVADVLDS